MSAPVGRTDGGSATRRPAIFTRRCWRSGGAKPGGAALLCCAERRDCRRAPRAGFGSRVEATATAPHALPQTKSKDSLFLGWRWGWWSSGSPKVGRQIPHGAGAECIHDLASVCFLCQYWCYPQRRVHGALFRIRDTTADLMIEMLRYYYQIFLHT